MGFDLAALNIVDFVAIIVLVVSGGLATLRGMTREIMGLAGWPISIVAARLSAPYLEPLLTDLIRVEGISQALAWGIPFIVVVVLWFAFSSLVSPGLSKAGLGGLDRWQGRLLGLLAGAGWPPSPGSIELDGQLDSSLTISSVGSQWQITKATGQIDSFGLTADGLEITEPRVLLSAVGSIDPERELVDLASAEVLTATASLRTKGLQVVTHDLTVDRLFDVLRGRLQGQADLARLQRWLSPTLPQYAASGRVWGTAELVDAGDGTSLLVELTGSQLAVGASPPPGEALQAARPIWNEPQLKASLDLLRPMTP
ncbi:MAG: CvpA family protein, partial [Planctomycetia bacterium]|nr:CvpA family protein [Planctomycetia bacterium]